MLAQNKMMQTFFEFTSRNQSIPEIIHKGDVAFLDSRHDEALNHYYAALKKERRLHGNDSVQAGSILHNIGLVLTAAGDSFAAMNSFEEALKIRQEKLGPGHEDAAETTAQMTKVLDNIRIQSGVGERQFVKGDAVVNKASVDVGTNLLEWGEYKEAERVLKECLRGVNDKDMSDAEKLKALSAMAELDRAQGKYEEAKELYLEALKTARKMENDSQSEIDMSIINSIAGYAEILRKGGDLWQAEALHRKVLNMLLAARTKQLEDGQALSPETDLHLAVSHTQLGCTVFAMKKYSDALKEHRSALTIRLQRLEFTDALISESFNYCAETLCAMGQGEDAIPLSLHAVDVRKTEFGTGHPAYAHALCVLSLCYHSVGRSHDARPLIEKCLRICEAAFPNKNHANIIPNLIVEGDILRAIGELENALRAYHRAAAIHKINFKPGQKDFQLEECQRKIDEAMEEMKNRDASLDARQRQHSLNSSFCSSASSLSRDISMIYNGSRIKDGGTPVIVITDIGRTIDDTIALIILASLKRMFILNPLAVIVNTAPEEDRANLARITLDSLGLHYVPVGVGTNGGSKGDIEFHCFEGVYTDRKPFRIDPSLPLITKVLEEAEPKSVKLLCISSLKDVSRMLSCRKDLFVNKIQEVIITGGASYSETKQQLLPDTSAYNNHCDQEAAKHVYNECQRNSIPTTTITRYAAYGCPFTTDFLVQLHKTPHLLALDIRNANASAMEKLWSKVNLSPKDPGRGKIPSRCDRDWFIKKFRDENEFSVESWQEAPLVYMYDPLAMLHCVEAYRDIHFRPKCYKVGKAVHRVTGLSDEWSGVINEASLAMEIKELLHQALKLSLEGGLLREAPTAKDYETDDDLVDNFGEDDEKSDEAENEVS